MSVSICSTVCGCLRVRERAPVNLCGAMQTHDHYAWLIFSVRLRQPCTQFSVLTVLWLLLLRLKRKQFTLTHTPPGINEIGSRALRIRIIRVVQRGVNKTDGVFVFRSIYFTERAPRAESKSRREPSNGKMSEQRDVDMD